MNGASVRALSGKTPTLFVFPKAVVYAPRTNLKTIAEETQVVGMTFDWFGHLQEVSLNNYIIT